MLETTGICSNTKSIEEIIHRKHTRMDIVLSYLKKIDNLNIEVLFKINWELKQKKYIETSLVELNLLKEYLK